MTHYDDAIELVSPLLLAFWKRQTAGWQASQTCKLTFSEDWQVA